MEPDEAGGIVIPWPWLRARCGRRYRLVTTEPTPYLTSRAASLQRRLQRDHQEMGLFMDTEFVKDCPRSQRYFTPADLKSPGLLLAAQIILPRISAALPSARPSVRPADLGPFRPRDTVSVPLYVISQPPPRV
ncbi:MAG: hypothetical protein ACLR7Z_04765 [Bilophila wadsworthia]